MSKESQFVTFAQQGDLPGVQSLIQQVDVNAIARIVYTDAKIVNSATLFHDKPSTALHEAATYGHTEVLQYLLENGAEINMALANGWTAIHCAAFNRQREAVLLLATEGARLDCRTEEGKTPIALLRDADITRSEVRWRKPGKSSSVEAEFVTAAMQPHCFYPASEYKESSSIIATETLGDWHRHTLFPSLDSSFYDYVNSNPTYIKWVSVSVSIHNKHSISFTTTYDLRYMLSILQILQEHGIDKNTPGIRYLSHGNIFGATIQSENPENFTLLERLFSVIECLEGKKTVEFIRHDITSLLQKIHTAEERRTVAAVADKAYAINGLF